MKHKLIIFILAICFMTLGGANIGVYASDTNSSTSPETYAIDTKATPAETSHLDTRRSLGARTDEKAVLMAGAPKGLSRGTMDERGWGNIGLPGEDWEIGEPGNVGYPIGDASLPILLSMIIIYFLYRGIASTKRRSNL